MGRVLRALALLVVAAGAGAEEPQLLELAFETNSSDGSMVPVSIHFMSDERAEDVADLAVERLGVQDREATIAYLEDVKKAHRVNHQLDPEAESAILVGIGCDKCGSSALLRYLSDSLDLDAGRAMAENPARVDELSFFRSDGLDSRRAGTLEVYLDMFAGGGRADRATVDVTPTYMPVTSVPRAVFEAYPPRMRERLRFVVILRDPVERAISAYNYLRRERPYLDHFDPKFGDGGLAPVLRYYARRYESCVADVREANARLAERTGTPAEEWEHRVWASCGLEAASVPDRPGLLQAVNSGAIYFQGGAYADMLALWRHYFPDFEKHFLVLFTAEMWANPRDVALRVARFANARVKWPSVGHTVINRGPSNGGAEGARMTPEDVAWLRAQYEPHDRRLAQLLGRELPWRALGP